jgi:hypothetical protein
VRDQSPPVERDQDEEGGGADDEQDDRHGDVVVLPQADGNDPAGHDQREVPGRQVAHDSRQATRRRAWHVARLSTGPRRRRAESPTVTIAVRRGYMVR